MSVTFGSMCGDYSYFAEFGIDNVRVERATACDRSGLRLTGVTVDDTPGAGGTELVSDEHADVAEDWNGDGVIDTFFLDLNEFGVDLIQTFGPRYRYR